MKLLLLLCLATQLSFIGASQTTLDGFSTTSPQLSDMKASESSFELHQTSKIEAVFTSEEYDRLLRLIELERRENESIYVLYSPFVTVYIPSRNELESK